MTIQPIYLKGIFGIFGIFGMPPADSSANSPFGRGLVRGRLARSGLLSLLCLALLFSLAVCSSDDDDDPSPASCSVSAFEQFSDTAVPVTSIYQLASGGMVALSAFDADANKHWAVVRLSGVTAETEVVFSFDPRYEIPGTATKATLVYSAVDCPLTDEEGDYGYPSFSFGPTMIPGDMAENYTYDESANTFDFSNVQVMEPDNNFSIVVAPTDMPTDGEVRREN